MSSPFLLALLGGLIGCLSFSVDVQAQTSFVWTTTTVSAGGTQTWGTGSNWIGGTAPAASGTVSLDFSGITSTVPNPSNLTLSNNISGLNIYQMTLGRPTTGQSISYSGNSVTWFKSGTNNPQIILNSANTGQSTISFSSIIPTGVTLEITGTGSGQIGNAAGSVISGAGGVLVNGTSLVWVPSGQNTYSGGTTLQAGEIAIGGNSTGSAGAVTAGPLGTGTLTLLGGTVRTAGGNDRTVLNQTQIGGNVKLGSSSGPNNLTFSGPMTLLGSGTTWTITAGWSSTTSYVLTLAGAIGDGGQNNGLTFASSGTNRVAIGGGSADTAANTYTGLTTVNAASLTVTLDKAAGTNAIAGNLTVAAGTVKLGRSNQIADTAALAVNGTFDLNGSSETVGAFSGSSTGIVTNSSAGAAILTVGGTTTGNVIYDGKIQDGAGTVGLVKQGSDFLILRGASTYSGGTTLNSGQIAIGNASALGTGTVLLNGGILRTLDGSSYTITNNVQIGGNVQFGIASTQSTLTITGSTTLLGSGTTRVISAGANVSAGNKNPVIFAGSIGDGGNNNGITIQGVSSSIAVVFNGSNTYTGATRVDNLGTLILNGSTSASSAVTVGNNGTLGGSGTIFGSLTVESGGTVSPGNSPGVLNSGAFDLMLGGTLKMELAGDTVGTGYDQLNVAGTVTLAGNLSLTLSYTPTLGTNFFLINNDDSDLVIGTFAGLAQNATFSVSGQLFKIGYTGNSGTGSFTGGNDVVVQAIPEPSTCLLMGIGALGVMGWLRRFRRMS